MFRTVLPDLMLQIARYRAQLVPRQQQDRMGDPLTSGRKVDEAWSTPLPCPARLRSGVAWVVVVALLFPSFFPLIVANPEWVLGVELSRHKAHGHSAGHSTLPDHENVYSHVPGAPGHPADHKCTPCQVLQNLVSYLPQSPLLLPPAMQYTSRLSDRFEPQRLGHIAALPPARAPPQAAV